MLNDRPTTGGYPVIAVVDAASLPAVARSRPRRHAAVPTPLLTPRPGGAVRDSTLAACVEVVFAEQSRRSRGQVHERVQHTAGTTSCSLPTMESRIFGLENEYGVTCTLRGQRRLSPDEVARYLFRRVVSWGRSCNVFLQNGARLYLDVGSHPEYATPECDWLYELVVHDKAGERILESLLVSAEQRLAEESIRGTVYLFKNNTDSAGNSYGCHENYCTNRRDDLGHYAEVLIPFLVSRQIYTGAGKVLQTARGATYSIAQRAEHIWEGVSRPPPAAARSSTPATSRTPTPSATAASTSSSATATCPSTRRSSRSGPPPACCGCSKIAASCCAT